MYNIPQSIESNIKRSNSLKGKEKTEKHKENLRKPKSAEKMLNRGPQPPQNIITCIHCGKSGGCGNMRRYHNDNCKFHPDKLSNTIKEIETKALKRSIKLEKIQTGRKLLADREEGRNISGRKKRKGNPGKQPLIQCVFCRKIGGNNSIKKWHGVKCKMFTELIPEPFFYFSPAIFR